MTRERRSSLAVQTTAGVAHAIAHMFVLLFATVVLVLEREWAMGYDSLFALSIPMSVLFGAAALPAGWLADRWSPTGMIGVYFFGLGAATVLTGLADGPLGLLAGLSAMGLFAAIYHPVGIPWLISHAPQRGRALGVNGVFGSAGMAAAALVAGGLSAVFGWRAAFIVPGALCLGCGVAFVIACRAGWIGGRADPLPEETAPPANAMRRVFGILAVTMLCAGMIYQTTAFALPKIFDERLGVWLDGNVLGIGGLVTFVYLASSLAQVFGGELADRYSLRGVYTATQFLQVPVLAVALVLFEPALVAAATLMVALNGRRPAGRERPAGAVHPRRMAGPRLRRQIRAHPRRLGARRGVDPHRLSAHRVSGCALRADGRICGDRRRRRVLPAPRRRARPRRDCHSRHGRPGDAIATPWERRRPAGILFSLLRAWRACRRDAGAPRGVPSSPGPHGHGDAIAAPHVPR